MYVFFFMFRLLCVVRDAFCIFSFFHMLHLVSFRFVVCFRLFSLFLFDSVWYLIWFSFVVFLLLFYLSLFGVFYLVSFSFVVYFRLFSFLFLMFYLYPPSLHSENGVEIPTSAIIGMEIMQGFSDHGSLEDGPPEDMDDDIINAYNGD